MAHSRLLLLAVLLRLAHGSIVAEDAQDVVPSLQRDPVLEAPLYELLSAPLELQDRDTFADLDVRLQAGFIQCRELGVSTLSYESAGVSDAKNSEAPALEPEEVAYCSRLRYVRHQRQRFRKIREELALDHSAAHDSNRPTIEQRRAEDVSFQEFFEQYAEPARPVVLELHDDDPIVELLGFSTLQKDGGDGLQRFLDICFDSGPVNDHRIAVKPLRIVDEACAELLQTHFRVPVYMVHDYVQRTNASRSEAFTPALVHLPPSSNGNAEGDVDAIVACPYGLHMLAIPVGDTTGARVSLYSRKFEPFVPSTETQDELREVALAVDANAAVGTSASVLDNDFFMQAPTLHYSVELESGRSVLFAPGGTITTMHSSSSSSPTQMLRFCYCDAANVNDVKQLAAVDALLYTGNKDEGSAAAAFALVQALQTPGFDSTFSRRPALSDLRWGSFVQWPRDPEYLSKKNRRRRGGEGNSDDPDAQEGAAPLSRRERLKLWQDDRRWERYIASLTLPVSWPPVVVNTTRTTATLRWQELYQPPKHDITSYGYEVRWKREEQDASTVQGVDTMRGGDGAVNVTHEQLTRSVMPSTLFGDDYDGRDLEAIVTGLRAETAYSFSVRLLVGEARGAPSGASRRVLTSPCAPPSGVRGIPMAKDIEPPCLTLRWIDVEDDGGRDIEFYLVAIEELPVEGEQGDADIGRPGAQDPTFVRESEKVVAFNASTSLRQVLIDKTESGALWRSTRVCGLFPGASYTFRVAAMNALGAGLWSRRSSRIEIPSKAQLSLANDRGRGQKLVVPTLKGVGDPGYAVLSGIETLSQPQLTALLSADPHRVLRASAAEVERDVSVAPLPRVVLSDTKEEIRVLADGNRMESGSQTRPERTFEAWASHYSPQLFDVSAELVLADPPDASTPLVNADMARDRVVLALRGGVPFVFKLHYAQRAGALGLIIADVAGSCAGSFDQSCVPGADKQRLEGFGLQDRHVLWRRTRIPCVLVLQDAAQELLGRLGRNGHLGP